MIDLTNGGTALINPPVRGVSAVFAILFTISGIFTCYQNSKYKSWRLLWILSLSSIVIIAGFICRECAAYFPQATFAASEGLILCGMPLLSTSLYIVLYCLVMQQQHLAPIRPFLICLIPMFLNPAVISLTCQGASTLFSPSSNISTQSSLAVLQAGIVLELSLCSIFIIILTNFHYRSSEERRTSANDSRQVKIIVSALYAAALLLLVCCIFRTVQIFSPAQSPVWKTGAFFWAFDALPLLATMVVLNVLHPGKILNGKGGFKCSRTCNDTDQESS